MGFATSRVVEVADDYSDGSMIWRLSLSIMVCDNSTHGDVVVSLDVLIEMTRGGHCMWPVVRFSRGVILKRVDFENMA